ncbi:quinon protein alcohol dehydrogenase-like superfamily [Gaertneriomyces semiglobifer]|nr:quinon protein alcohol dehydrogenase-like superfamily [Gaertneriomyces semiglobifer]
MEHRQTINDAHSKPILCLEYNPHRREILSAGEDAVIRVWDEGGKFLSCLTDHVGWVTGLLYVREHRVLFSVSIDGMLIAWGTNGKPIQKVETGSPIYSLAYNPRRQQLMLGCNKLVRIYQRVNNEDNRGVSKDVLEEHSVTCLAHDDIVSCVVSVEGRFYSAGYDQKIVIYDIPHHGNLKLRVSNVISNAHHAAISCMIYGKDADNSWYNVLVPFIACWKTHKAPNRLITGSFDRSVRLWSLDGNLLQRFEGLSDTITSLCYVLPTQTLWIAANSHSPIVYDPRSGVNVSDFVRLGGDQFSEAGGGACFKHLVFVPEVNQVLASTNRRCIVVWKHSPLGAVTLLPGHQDVVECLAYTTKEPLLFFSGGDDGVIRKWERLQLNTFMYSQEILDIPKEEVQEEPPLETTFSRIPEVRRLRQAALHKRISAKLQTWQHLEDVSEEDGLMLATDALAMGRKKTATFRTPASGRQGMYRGLVTAAKINGKPRREREATSKPGVVAMTYSEELDMLIAGYEDSKIRGYAYNEENMSFLPETPPEEGIDAGLLADESVANRVAGMSMKFTLEEHHDAVTGIACFSRDGASWLLSTGFDRRICLWTYNTLLKVFELHDIFNNASAGYGKEELAADGSILDLEYSAERNEFGYASADKLTYIRSFSPRASEMVLRAVLHGHEAEVRWNKIFKQWVTGSEDRTVRIWSAEGIPCLRIINNVGPVTALCIDNINGAIITGSQDKFIRVFDPEQRDQLVQKNMGHGDEVRSVIHVAARNQYISASWDNTIRIWNAYLKKGQKGHLPGATQTAQSVPVPVDLVNELPEADAPRPSKNSVYSKNKVDRAYQREELEKDVQYTFSSMEGVLTASSVGILSRYLVP